MQVKLNLIAGAAALLIGGAVYDALIAATAREAGATLLTLDARAVRTYRAVGADIGVSQGSVRNALVLADDGTRTEEACPATTSDTPPEPEPEPEPGAGLVVDAGKDCSAVASGDPAVLGAVPVLARVLKSWV